MLSATSAFECKPDHKNIKEMYISFIVSKILCKTIFQKTGKELSEFNHQQFLPDLYAHNSGCSKQII